MSFSSSSESFPLSLDVASSSPKTQQQQQQQQQSTLRKISGSSSGSSSSFRRLRPLLIVVLAAVTTSVVILWAVTQQSNISYYDAITTTNKSIFSQTSNFLGNDFWVPTETVDRIRNVSSSNAALSSSSSSSSSLFPLPHMTQQSVVVLVMSARKHFDFRTAIRQTWAKGHDNVYFLVAAPCPFPPSQRFHSMGCQPRQRGDTVHLDDEESREYTKGIQQEQKQLLREQATHHDLIYLDEVKESYRGLPQKLKEAYDWVLQQFDSNGSSAGGIRWLVKVDDDTVVRVDTLQDMLTRYNADIPMIIGRIIHKSPVHRDGKWAEHPRYKQMFYPIWPQGSCGHVVSRPVAEFLARNKRSLFNYQGEDTSLGIWLDESMNDENNMRNKTVWIHTPYFINDGDCYNQDWIIMGHEITPPKMKACYQHGDEVQRTQVWEEKRAKFNQQVDFVKSPPRTR